MSALPQDLGALPQDAPTSTTKLDLDAFAAEIAAIHKEYVAKPGPDDLAHLRKMETWTVALATFGYLTALVVPNPVSMGAISTARFARWAMLSHHVGHKGYERIEGVPSRYTSAGWGAGAARLRDWLDWMTPAAWKHEHNVMHHYRLGETADPDLVEERAWLLRDPRIPALVKWPLVLVTASLWKPLYYAPTTQRALYQHESKAAAESGGSGGDLRETPVDFWVDWLPFHEVGRRVWLRSWLPYIGVYFVLLPGLASLISPFAGLSLLINLLGAEILTNWHAFVVIAPNHAGDDVWRFDGPGKGKTEFYLRQIVGSVNYRTGGDGNDFLHGWLNYQIEHHLFPNASMRQLQRMQPAVKALCEKHGIPYVQGSVWGRVWKLLQIMVGATSMKRLPAGAPLPF